MKHSTKLIFFLSIFPVALVYFRLFLSGGVGGDTVSIFPSMFKDFSLFPYAWSWTPNNGFGGFISPFTASQFLTVAIHILGSTLSFPWKNVFDIVFVIPFLICGYFFSLMVARSLSPHRSWTFFVPVIYLLNTYVLMLIGGGQMVVALAYTLIPVVWYLFYRVCIKPSTTLVALSSLALGIQVMLDLRFAYITLVAVAIFFLFALLTRSIKLGPELLVRTGISLISIGVITALLQAFWLLPTALKHQSPLSTLGSAYTSSDAVSYFSFAKFENTISLLHPNWPENIFGKTYFMRPEFLLLTLIAFSSLFFIRSTKEAGTRKIILYLSFLSLIAAFLAKGANDPFGSIYVFLFDHAPGFVMFRDSSKWYSLIAFSYSLLIPFSLANFYQALAKIPVIRKNLLLIGSIIVCSCITYLLLSPALLGQLGGTFHKSQIPGEYLQLEQRLSSDHTFSRVLWLPTTQHYGYSSSVHPAVIATDFFATSSARQIVTDLYDPATLVTVKQASIGYIIVPYDSEKEIYTTNSQYDPTIQPKLTNEIATIKGVQKDDSYHHIGMFIIPGATKLFWSTDPQLRISSKSLDPSRFELTLSNARKGDRVVFSESFDPFWQLDDRGDPITSVPYLDKYNSFTVQRDGNYTAILSYRVQSWTTIGTIISVIIAFFLLLYLIFSLRRILVTLF